MSGAGSAPASPSFANIFEPDVIVLGGGVSKALGDLMVEPAPRSCAGARCRR